jgi:hypothetical protein
MIKKHAAIFAFVMSLLAACSSGDPSHESKTCLENKPESISGLNVTGERSEKNVINNMWPVICKARELYQERLKVNPELKGTIDLRLSVEFNGEVGPYSIVRNTIEDLVFEKQIMALIQFMDFDSYGPHNSESQILLPLQFNP